MPGRIAAAVAAAIVVVTIGACAGDDDQELARRTPSTTATTAAAATTTTEPTTTTVEGVVVADEQPATPSCPPVPAQQPPDPSRPSYLMDIRVLPEENAVDGRLVVRFAPDLPTERLVFRLWPNGPRPAGAGAHLDAGPVFLGSSVPAPVEQPDPTTLIVDVGRELRPGEEIEATVPWRLTLPGPSNDRLSREGDAIRLGSFYPVLAWEPGIGWAEEPATSAFAESSTVPVADYSYAVTVPEGLTVLASGTPDRGRWQATAMRDIAISVGRFRLAQATANAPTPVDVTVGVHETLDDDPEAYLRRTVGALEDFARRFGPYPYPTHTLALTPTLSGGIEYPGHVMQGPRTIGRTTSHEVGHMWFYALVGNNQGRDPWLDEGLASWAEARFEGSLDEFRAKLAPSWARGRTAEPMTWWESRQSGYYRGVYVQGALALAALGDPELVDCGLRHYVAANAFRIARPGNLVMALSQVFPDAPATLARFGIA